MSRRSKSRSSDGRLGDRFRRSNDQSLWMAITDWEYMTNCAICRDIIQVTSSTLIKSVCVVIYWVSDKRLTVIYVTWRVCNSRLCTISRDRTPANERSTS